MAVDKLSSWKHLAAWFPSVLLISCSSLSGCLNSFYFGDDSQTLEENVRRKKKNLLHFNRLDLFIDPASNEPLFCN